MAKKASSKTAVPKPQKATNNSSYWIGFDLGGTKMMACVLDDQFQVLGVARKSSNGSQGAAKGIKRIIATVKDAIASAGVELKNIKGIGIKFYILQ